MPGLFLLAGVVGCRMVHMAPMPALSTLFRQFSFAVTRVDRNGNDLWLQGTCRAYFRDTPAYRIVMRSETTGQERQAVTDRDGENFRAAVSASPDEKWEVLVQFKYYAPVKTATYIHKDRVEYVSGEVPGPCAVANTGCLFVKYRPRITLRRYRSGFMRIRRCSGRDSSGWNEWEISMHSNG